MRIVFCVDKLSGGAGNVVQQLACHFSQNPANEVVITLMEDNVAEPKYDLSKVKIVNRNLSLPQKNNLLVSAIHYIRQLKHTRSLIMSRHPDVVVSFLNSVSPEILFSLIGTGVPVLVSERSNPYQEWDENSAFFNFKWWLSYLLANKIIYQFDVFSDFIKSAKRNGKAVVIPNMIYMPDTQRKKVASNKVRFCTFATLYSVKRQDMMIDFFDRVHREFPDTELNIYGSGILYNKLSQKASEVGDVHLKGPVVSSYTEHCNNDVFLLTSEREGFPNALVEAFASGLPGIVLRCHDGMKELFDGNSGFLVDDADAFTDAMKAFAANPSLVEKMGVAAKNVAERYSFNRVMPLWEKILNDCTGK